MCLQIRFVAKIKRKKVNLKEEYFKVKYLTAGNEKKGRGWWGSGVDAWGVPSWVSFEQTDNNNQNFL